MTKEQTPTLQGQPKIVRIGKKNPKVRPHKEVYKKKYYESSYGKPDCPYEGNKRGRKSLEERQRPVLKTEKKSIILFFD